MSEKSVMAACVFVVIFPMLFYAPKFMEYKYQKFIHTFPVPINCSQYVQEQRELLKFDQKLQWVSWNSDQIEKALDFTPGLPLRIQSATLQFVTIKRFFWKVQEPKGFLHQSKASYPKRLYITLILLNVWISASTFLTARILSSEFWSKNAPFFIQMRQR